MSNEKTIAAFVIEQLKEPCARIASIYTTLALSRNDGVEISKVRDTFNGAVIEMLGMMMNMTEKEVIPRIEEIGAVKE